MGSWRIDEFTLTTFHLQKGFLDDILAHIEPWVRRVQDVRQAILDNALDSKRKDQWFWMQRYEDMLAEKAGERVRFLPRESKEATSGRKQSAEPEPDPGEAVVEFE